VRGCVETAREPRSGDSRDALPHLLGALALMALVAAAIFLDLGRPYLWDPGESRYAEAVREMLVTRNWIVPTLNFEHYYDKPPAFYWLVAAGFQVFGNAEWVARLPAATAAVLTIACTVVFGWRRIGPRAALAAGAILTTAIEFVILARSVRMDMLLTFVVAGTILYAFELWDSPVDDPTRARRHAPVTWPIYVLPALGVLIKGPIAIVVPVLTVALLAILTGEYARLRRLRPGVGALFALALASTWYIAAAIRAPDYLWIFLWRQNVDRFVGSGLGPGHVEPIWFYVWVLPLTFLPWSLFAPGALRRGLVRARRGDDLALLLLVWIGVVFGFFTLSKAKLATYMLPAFPPLALVVGAYVVEAMRAPAGLQRSAFRIPGLLWAAVMVVGSVGTVIGVAIRYPAYASQSLIALVLLAFPLAVLAALNRARWQAVPLLVLVGAFATHALFYRSGSAVVNELSSLRRAAEAARDLPGDAAIFAYKTRGHSFTFYDGRKVQRLRSAEDAASVLDRAEPAGVLTKARYLKHIREHLTAPVCVWWQSAAGRVLLANVSPPGTTPHQALAPLTPGSNAQAAADRPPPC